MCKISRNIKQESSSLKSLAIQKPKPEKRRNNEKRKEKSRDAARCRRSRETEIFTELAGSLPMKTEEVEHLDKASVMRLSISYLKIRNMLKLFPKIKNLDLLIENESKNDDCKDDKKDFLSKYVEDDQLTVKALDGFLLILSDEGDITYVSDNISDILGLSKIDLLGQPIWDYAHACDHEELRETLKGRKTSPSELLSGSKTTDCNPLLHRNMMLRLKCTLTKSGRFVNIKSAAYKVIHLTGHIVFNDDGYRQLLAIGRPLAHPSNIEVPLGSSTFLTKHSLDMKFSYVDNPKMYDLLGYKPENLLGKSLYDYHHGSDSESLMTSFKSLISKGQTETNRYRFLARNGGFMWIVTQATMVYDKQKPQSVVCVNYVLSGIENEQEILSCAQLEAQQELSKVVDSKGAQGATTLTEKKVIKRDNIVLGISDLKQKKVDVKFASGNTTKTVTKSIAIDEPETIKKNKKEAAAKKIVINPNNTTIKVNNCEIVNHRPISVTAAIFSQPSFATSNSEINQKEKPTKIVNKSRLQSATAKIFRPNPQTIATSVTRNIFAPRTKDMNKGFLMFSENEPGLTMLKDEPDDLTHLAPTAGDACIPLDEAAPFFSDMFDDFIIPDSYNELLTDELNSLDSSCSKTTQNSSSNDPFINYRDDSSDICHSPHLLSPGLSKSPDANSLPSLCSPGSLPEDELAFMTLNMDDDLDMSMRAPYISMSEASELPMLIAEDLMWGAQPDIKDAINASNKKVELNMSSQDVVESQQREEQKSPQITVESSLASLLCNQLLQQHQQKINQQQQEQQIILNQEEPNVKIKILEQKENVKVNPITLISQQENQNQEEKTRASSGSSPSSSSSPEALEWTMDDLFLLRKKPALKINEIKVENEADKIIVNITQLDEHQAASNTQQQQHQHQSSETVKSKERMTVNHKRPSLSNDIISSKRVKSQPDVMVKTTPQLFQQVITMNNQKIRGKNNESLSSWSSSQKDQQSQQQQHHQQQQQASNSVLMNLLISGCDTPLTIETPAEPMEVLSDESLSSPIVINDKMLSHSADVVPAKSLQSLLTPNDMEIYRAIQHGVTNRKIENDPCTNFIDNETISSILMDLNAQDYEVNIPVNELMKMM